MDMVRKRSRHFAPLFCPCEQPDPNIFFGEPQSWNPALMSPLTGSSRSVLALASYMSMIFFFGRRSSSMVMPLRSSDSSTSLFSASTSFCTVCRDTLHFSAGQGHGQHGGGQGFFGGAGREHRLVGGGAESHFDELP